MTSSSTHCGKSESYLFDFSSLWPHLSLLILKSTQVRPIESPKYLLNLSLTLHPHLSTSKPKDWETSKLLFLSLVSSSSYLSFLPQWSDFCLKGKKLSKPTQKQKASNHIFLPFKTSYGSPLLPKKQSLKVRSENLQRSLQTWHKRPLKPPPSPHPYLPTPPSTNFLHLCSCSFPTWKSFSSPPLSSCVRLLKERDGIKWLTLLCYYSRSRRDREERGLEFIR